MSGPYPQGAVSGRTRQRSAPTVDPQESLGLSQQNQCSAAFGDDVGWVPADGHFAEQPLTHQVDHIDDAGVRLDDV